MRRRGVLVGIQALSSVFVTGCLEFEETSDRQRGQGRSGRNPGVDRGSNSDTASETADRTPGLDASGRRTDTVTRQPTESRNTHELVLDFDETVEEQTINPDAGSNRKLAFLCGRLELFNADTESLVRYDIGNPDAEPAFVTGAYHTEQSSFENRTYRWFGGPDARTTIRVGPFDPPDAQPTTALLRGTPATDNEIEADVSFDGERTDHVVFGERGGWQTYQFGLE